MKYVFFDIDHTLWDSYENIPESTVRAIRKLRENGHAAYINTGRSRSNTFSKKLWDIGFDGIIAACGCHIERDGQILYERLLTDEQIARSRKVLFENHMPVIYEGPEYHYMNPEDFPFDPFVERLQKRLGDLARPLDELTNGCRVNKFSADIYPSTDLDLVRNKLFDFDFIIYDMRVTEIVLKGSGKSKGIEKLMELEGVDIDDVYAIGDSINDMDMIDYVRHGIVMGNGDDKLKAVAEYVTDDMDKDGVEKALMHYGLI